MTRLISEAQFQNTVIEIFQAHGCPVFHIGDSRREIRRRDGTRLLVGDHRARGYPDLTIAGTPDRLREYSAGEILRLTLANRIQREMAESGRYGDFWEPHRFTLMRMTAQGLEAAGWNHDGQPGSHRRLPRQASGTRGDQLSVREMGRGRSLPGEHTPPKTIG